MFIVPKIPTYFCEAEGENLYLVSRAAQYFNLANEADFPMSTCRIKIID
jgi:hypothetical protein